MTKVHVTDLFQNPMSYSLLHYLLIPPKKKIKSIHLLQTDSSENRVKTALSPKAAKIIK